MGLIATTGGVTTVDIEVEAARPQKPAWCCVSDTEVVRGWFKLKNVELAGIDGVPTTGAETNPAAMDVATGSVVDAGEVDVEGCEVKLAPFGLSFSGVGGDNCWGSVASSCRSSASVASTLSTPLSFTLVLVDMLSMALEITKSPQTAKGAGLRATGGVGVDVEVETAGPSKPT